AEVGQHLVNNSQSPGAIAGLAPPPVDISSRRQWRSTAHVVFIAKLPGHLAAGPELPQRHGARSQGQNREIRNGGSLPGSDSREGARSKRRKAAAGDGEGAYMDVRDRAGFGENAAPRRLSPRPAPLVNACAPACPALGDGSRGRVAAPPPRIMQAPCDVCVGAEG